MFEQSKWFYNEFCKIFEDSVHRQEAIDNYVHNTDFTSFVTTRINEIIKKNNYKSQNEYFRIDASGYKSRLSELHKIRGFNRHLWDLEIAVEHENNHKDWLDEIIKLAHICCPLRVVIGYIPWKKRAQDEKYLNYASNALSKLKCINNVKNGEFLVILGNADTRGNIEKYFDYKAYILNTESLKFIPLNENSIENMEK